MRLMRLDVKYGGNLIFRRGTGKGPVSSEDTEQSHLVVSARCTPF
jgi:hypothetical protein